jgi:hypothetical protein
MGRTHSKEASDISFIRRKTCDTKSTTCNVSFGDEMHMMPKVTDRLRGIQISFSCSAHSLPCDGKAPFDTSSSLVAVLLVGYRVEGRCRGAER